MEDKKNIVVVKFHDISDENFFVNSTDMFEINNFANDVNINNQLCVSGINVYKISTPDEVINKIKNILLIKVIKKILGVKKSPELYENF